MAKLYPPAWIEDRPLRSAEKRFYQAFRGLSDAWTIIHDKGWIEGRAPKSHPYWQADFLILHPSYGLFLLGIKGGELFIEQNVWKVRTYQGDVFTVGRGRNPLEVDYDCIRTLHRTLSKQLKGLPNAFGNILGTPGSEFPSNRFFLGIERGRIIDQRDLLSIEKALERSVQFWASQPGFPTGAPGWFQPWIDKLLPVLAPTAVFASSIGTALQLERQQMLQLTEEQSKIWMESFSATSHFAVRGCAGSGKTILAEMLARRWARLESRKKVLLCCYNRPLANWLQRNLADQSSVIRVATIYDLWQESFGRLGYPFDESRSIDPDAVRQAQHVVANDDHYHAIIVDEAQDFQQGWWQALELRLAPKGRLAIFYDDNQRVYRDRFYPTDLQTYRLSVNLRTTKRIHQAINFYYRGAEGRPEVLMNAPEGEYPSQVIWSTEREATTMVGQIITDLLDQHVPHDEIAIITPTEPQLNRLKAELQEIEWSEPDQPAVAGRIVASTIRRFKGLERGVIIVAALDRASLPTAALDELLYVAFSRAKNRLILAVNVELKDEKLFPSSLNEIALRPRAEILTMLTDEQQKAVLAPLGVTLIRAGAGSGKTRVLANRIAYFIDTHSVDPTSIVAVTFTKKAAQELRRRVNELTHDQDRSPLVNTFHSLAIEILRNGIASIPGKVFHGRTARFAIISDREDILGRVLFHESTAKVALFSAWIEEQKREGKILNQIRSRSTDIQEKKKAWKAYEAYLKAHNLMDFDDVINEAGFLLQEHPAIRKQVLERWHHFLIDEFQDTNPPQFDLVRLLIDPFPDQREEPIRSLTVVGDAQQAIYSWRGADYRIFRDIKNYYPNAEEYTLTINHRSDPPVVFMADAIAREDVLGVPPLQLQARSSNRDVLIDVIHAKSLVDEAEEIAKYILAAHTTYDVQWNEIAILMRSPNSREGRMTLIALQKAFVLKRIPCRSHGVTPFHRHPIIESLTRLLCVLANPDDDYHLEQWLSCRLFQQVTRKRIANIKKKQGQKGSKTLWGYLWPPTERESVLNIRFIIARQLGGIKSIGPKIVERLIDAVEILVKFLPLRENLQSQAPRTIFDTLLQIAGELDIVQRLAKTIPEQAPEDQENGEGALSVWRDFMTEALEKTSDLIEAAQTVFFQGVDYHDTEQSSPQQEQAVQILSIHSSKGREYDMVFVVGFEDGIFPSAKADTTEKQLEEARVCYVALTRARHHLILSIVYQSRLMGARDTQTLEMIEGGTTAISRFFTYLRDPLDTLQQEQSTRRSIFPVQAITIMLRRNDDVCLERLMVRVQEFPGTIPVYVEGVIDNQYLKRPVGKVMVRNERDVYDWLGDDDWDIVCDVNG
ncbi:UvrD-helicase domain-containing protein [Herpetosiphon gulosus]|uniref:DNA 3'-5' helicase n=1 Tax=Herpetosiphon gulosus TaxID=1973496 RepID=A0ABP9X7E6_9CHLR